MKTSLNAGPKPVPHPGLRRRRVALVTGPLVAAALVAGLSACGSDGGDDTATDPAGSTSEPSDSPTQTPTETSTETPTETPTTEEPGSGGGAAGPIEATGSAGITEAQLIDQTDAGGTVSEMAFALDADQAVADFTAGLESGFDAAVVDTVAQLSQESPDATPYGAVVSIGCEPPRSVAIDAGEAGFTVLPKLPKSTVECLAPVTYVVVFAAPNA